MGIWFRMYTSTVNNAKVQALPAPLFKAWINLLCLAKDNGGAVPPLDEVAFQLRCSQSQAKKWIADLAERRLFDLDESTKAMHPHDWNEHQYISDVSTGRVKKFRETHMKRFKDVSETPSDTEQIQSRDRNRAETETAAAASAANSPPPQCDWPLAFASVTVRFPATDAGKLQEIATAARAVCPGITDLQLAQAIDTAWVRGQKSASLFLRTVPAVLHNQAAQNPASNGTDPALDSEQTEREIQAKIDDENRLTLELFARSDEKMRVWLKKSWPNLAGKWPESEQKVS